MLTRQATGVRGDHRTACHRRGQIRWRRKDKPWLNPSYQLEDHGVSKFRFPRIPNEIGAKKTSQRNRKFEEVSRCTLLSVSVDILRGIPDHGSRDT